MPEKPGIPTVFQFSLLKIHYTSIYILPKVDFDSSEHQKTLIITLI
jgi:hypothetical protein